MNQYNIQNMLDACGYNFRSLSLHSNGRWIAKSGKSGKPFNKLFNGKTAGEALYKLMVEVLNENKQ